MKKILAFILIALMILSFAACAKDDAFSDVDAKKLPSKVDLRNIDGKNYVTPVKSQKFGDCWTFSLAGSAEIAYLYANDMGVPAGEINDQVDFSEKYFAWYMFHPFTKDDVAGGRVRASQVGEGYDPSKAEKTDKNAVYNIGGEYIHYANLFGSGFGPVDESTEIDGETPYRYESSAKEGWTLPLNAEYRIPPSQAFLRNAYVLPCPATTDADGHYIFNEEALNALKYELTQGHGVSIAFSSAGCEYITDHRAAYCSNDSTADHAVTVVGYDDDFPKEYFSKSGDESSMPESNGALIIKNSWGVIGDDEDDLDDGYFYLSYYDHSLFSPMSYVFDDTKTVKHTAQNIDQYDLMMTRWYGVTDQNTEAKMANVFDAEEDENLFQISYVSGSPKTETTYEIYKDIEDGDPASGILLEKSVDRQKYAGVHKVDLKQEYPLQKGETYAVVLTMKRVVGEDDSMIYTEVFPYSTEFSTGLTVRGIINRGESYLYADGTWRDIATMKDSLIERAYTQCNEELGKRKNFTPIKLDSKETFTVDNYPIKAILSPANSE